MTSFYQQFTAIIIIIIIVIIMYACLCFCMTSIETVSNLVHTRTLRHSGVNEFGSKKLKVNVTGA